MCVLGLLRGLCHEGSGGEADTARGITWFIVISRLLSNSISLLWLRAYPMHAAATSLAVANA